MWVGWAFGQLVSKVCTFRPISVILLREKVFLILFVNCLGATLECQAFQLTHFAGKQPSPHPISGPLVSLDEKHFSFVVAKAQIPQLHFLCRRI